jgi:hypothetical protein
MPTRLAAMLSALLVSIAGITIAQAQSTSGEDSENKPHDGTTKEVDGRKAAQVQGVTLFAVVGPDGSLARGSGVLRSRRIRGCSGGCYEVIFKLNVRRCAYLATIGKARPRGVEATGTVTTVGRATDVRGVFLTTTDSSGSFAPRGFHLAVHC